MKDVEYGISDVNVAGKVSKTIKFGDGNTRIYSAFWGEQFGVQLIRNAILTENSVPFESNNNKSANWVEPSTIKDESVFIVFDNVKSIDALINQLQFVKENHNQYNCEGQIKDEKTMKKT